MDDARTLHGLYLFRDVPLEEIGALCHMAAPVSFAAAEVVLNEGQVADEAFLLVEGLLEASVMVGGKRQILGTIRPGEVVGEQGLFVEGGRRNAVVTALEPSRSLVLTRGLLEQASRNQAIIALENHLLRTMADRIRRTNRAIQTAGREAAADRKHGRKGPGLRERLLSLLGASP